MKSGITILLLPFALLLTVSITFQVLMCYKRRAIGAVYSKTFSGEDKMKYSLTVLAICLVLVSAGKLLAADSAPPKDDGYIVVGESTVNGEFKGCNAQVGIRITNILFICTTFGFSPILYYPKVTVFKNKKGEYKVLINGTEYMGYFFNGYERTEFP